MSVKRATCRSIYLNCQNIRLTPSRLIIKGGLSRQVPLQDSCVTSFIHCRACHTGYGLLVLIDFASAETRTHYRDFKTWCKSKKAQQKIFSISTRKAKMSSAFSPRLKSEFGIKKEDAHVFVAQKAGTFFLQSDYRNKGTRSDEPRGQPCMPHRQPVVLVPLRRHRRGYTACHCGAQRPASPPLLCPR